MAELLSGRLGPISLSGLLQLVDAEAIDGWIRVQDKAELAVREGLVVHARWASFEGMDAFKLMFLEDDINFSLTDEDPPDGRPLGMTTNLVFHALRFVDEWQRMAARRLRPVEGFSTDDPVVEKVAEYLIGELTVAEAINIAGFAPSAAIDGLTKAWSEGMFEEAGEPAPDRVNLSADDDLSFGELIDVGRDHLKSKDYIRAELAFLRALRMEPESGIARQNLNRVRQLRRAHR